MPKPYPQEFRDDVVRVAQNREDGVTLEQIAADFGIHPMTLQKWIRKTDVEAGIKPGTNAAASQELREAKRRVRLGMTKGSTWAQTVVALGVVAWLVGHWSFALRHGAQYRSHLAMSVFHQTPLRWTLPQYHRQRRQQRQMAYR